MNAGGQPIPEFERTKVLGTEMGKAQAGVLNLTSPTGRDFFDFRGV
jgi:hypothetical protein